MEIPDHDKVGLLSSGWLSAFRSRPIPTVLVVILLIIISVVIKFGSAYISEKGAQLAQVEEKVLELESSVSEISEVLETLVVSERVLKLDSNNAIILKYEPIPNSVRIILGHIVSLPIKEYGFELDGNRIRVISDLSLSTIQGYMPKGGVTVEYIRKVSFEKDT